jgi:hypothetical protein
MYSLAAVFFGASQYFIWGAAPMVHLATPDWWRPFSDESASGRYGRANRRILEHERPKQFMTAQRVHPSPLNSLRRKHEADEKVRDHPVQWIVADLPGS